VGYCFGIRSERRLCDEVHLNLAYRWFCRLGLDGAVPDRSALSKARHGRFRASDLLRVLFEETVWRCIREGLGGGEVGGTSAMAELLSGELCERDRCRSQAGVRGPRWRFRCGRRHPERAHAAHPSAGCDA
jgi:hypothetical protein